MWKAALTLPLIGKAAVVQTECLDHSPLLWTLWNYCFCLLSWVMLQWAVTPEFNVSPCPPPNRETTSSRGEARCSWHVGLRFIYRLFQQDFVLIDFIFNVQLDGLNEYIYPNTVLKHSFELLILLLLLFYLLYSPSQLIRLTFIWQQLLCRLMFYRYKTNTL